MQITELAGVLVPTAVTVGHIPMEISRCCSFFIDLGGSISGIVVDVKARRSPIPSAGLEIKLSLTFRGPQELLNKAK